MPTFDFTAPDGKSYSVEGPEGATPTQAFQILQQHLSSPSIGEDAAKSIGSGLENATAGVLGAVGNARDLGSSAADYVGDKLGVAPDKVQAFKSLASKAAMALPAGRLVNNAPNSQDILNSASDPLVDPNYKPQSALGAGLKTAAEFVPGMLAGGPEGLLPRFLTNVAAPAATSELAGQLTKGTATEPYARLGGALVGGGGASRVAQEFNAATRAASKAVVPSGEDILKAGRARFKSAEDMGLVATPDFATGAAAKMRADLKGFDPETNPVFKAADRLERLGSAPKSTLTPAQKLQAEMNWESTPPPAPASPVAMNDVEMIRKELSSLKKSPDGATREAARRAIESLQESQISLNPSQVLKGDAASYVSTMKNAIGDYAAAKNWQTLQGKRNLAELNANSPVGMLDSAVGGQSLQRTMKQLARPVNNTDVPVARKLGFKPDEVAAINQAAMGNTAQHAAELLDRLVPAKLGAIPAGILRHIGGLDTKRQVSALDSLVRSRSPYAQQIAAAMPPVIVNKLPAKTQRLLRTLALAAPVARDQIIQNQGQPVG